jgi:hypothetical protein
VKYCLCELCFPVPLISTVKPVWFRLSSSRILCKKLTPVWFNFVTMAVGFLLQVTMRRRLSDLTVLLLEQLRSRRHVSPCSRSLSCEIGGFPPMKNRMALCGTLTFITICATTVQFFPIHTPHNYLFNNLEPKVNVIHSRL